jgi:hypothetical protein
VETGDPEVILRRSGRKRGGGNVGEKRMAKGIGPGREGSGMVSQDREVYHLLFE